jgi:hypothetical protein
MSTYASQPLAIDLFCGLGGWTEGLLAEGYRVIGFDIERHVYGQARYPAQLVLQDVLTLHGAQFKDAALIVASPPCQAYSYRAMPWKRAKALPPPDNTLFEACFRIQREACEASGRHIPLVVENVRGAQKWVGRARWHFGSFYLWGDVPALMPQPASRKLKGGQTNWRDHDKPGYRGDQLQDHFGVKVSTMGAGWYPPGHQKHVPSLAFNGHAARTIKNTGGSWFNIGSPGQKVTGQNLVNTIANASEGTKQRGSGHAWYRGEVGSLSSKSSARKAASAHIAKIPLVLSRHIAGAWKPLDADERTA